MVSAMLSPLADTPQFTVVSSEYFSQNNLHARPLSARIFHLINTASVYGYKAFASSNDTQGDVFKEAIHVAAASGMLLNSVAALVEGVATGIIAIAASCIHVATGAKSEFLQKYTLKCWSYSFNATFVFITQLVFIRNAWKVDTHLYDAIILSLQSFSSDLVALGILGSWFNQVAKRALPATYIRHFLVESIQAATIELTEAAQADGLLSADHRPVGGMSFFDRYPAHRDTLQMVINRLHGMEGQPLSEENREAIRLLVADFMEFIGVAQQDPEAELYREEGIIPLNNSTNASDVDYQKKLEMIVKEAFVEVYKKEELVRLLCNDANAENPVQEGRDALEGFYADIYAPLAGYAQYLELEKELTCPQRFSSRALSSCNHRERDLRVAQAEFKELTTAEKKILVKMLLKASSDLSSIEVIDPAQKAKLGSIYVKIGALAGQLYQGPLMNRMVLNLTDPAAIVSGVSLFQKACQKALREISGQPSMMSP